MITTYNKAKQSKKVYKVAIQKNRIKQKLTCQHTYGWAWICMEFIWNLEIYLLCQGLPYILLCNRLICWQDQAPQCSVVV